MKQKTIWLMLLIVLTIHGCGGGSGGTKSFVEGENNPAFLSSNHITIQKDEIETFTFKVVAKDASEVVYYVIGGDSDAFVIDMLTGVMNFKSVPSQPKATYKFNFVAEDSLGHREVQKFTLTVIGGVDRAEMPSGANRELLRDDSKKIVTDSSSKLMWQDDEEAMSVQKPWITRENYLVCIDNISSDICNDTSGDTATNYCEELTLGGYEDWRLPSITELTTIMNKNGGINKEFKYTSDMPYWSSTVGDISAEKAKVIVFSNGRVGVDVFKGSETYIRCVRDME